MPWLGAIDTLDSKSTLKSTNGVLTDPAKGLLISFPARMMQGTYSTPSTITKIGASAFANAFYLSSVTFSNITEIGKAAFMNSRVRTLNLPSTLKSIDAFAFASCPDLTNLNFKSTVEKLPPYMAKGSSKLAEVTYQAGLPKAIGNGAFANCTALTKHPFSNFELGDSIFANTGFETVVFDDASLIDNPVSKRSGSAAFADCKNLTKIDISALVTGPDALFNDGSFFASNCPKLTEILFPSYSYFYQVHGNSDNQASAVVNNPRLNKIILGCWLSGGGFNDQPVFSLSPVKPNVFMKVDGLVGSAEFAVPVAGNFVSNDGSTFKPIFYWEAPYAPASDYVINGATYYVPGGSMDKFSAAIDAGCYVEEFYRLQLSTVNNGLVINIKEVFPDMVKLKKIATDAVSYGDATYGEFNTAIPPKYVKYIKITYEVHGVEFTTTYDQSLITAASNDDLSADIISDSTPTYYDLQGMKVTNPQPGHIYIVKHNGQTFKQVL